MSNIVPTYVVEIHMAGDIEDAKRQLRRECYPPGGGLCVTVEPETFIYTGGEEQGFKLTLRNYPRFPSDPADLWVRAIGIADRLIPALCQWTAMVVDPEKTAWLNHRPEDQR